MDALAVAERIRTAVSGPPVPTSAGEVLARISVGVATIANGDDGLRGLLSQADVALYQAKKAGRDQVQAWYPGMTLVP
jgi:diguanylate cyclase (GGDEF)-like protein